VKAASVCRSHSRSFLAVGTNFGGVRVHSWPCLEAGVGASPSQHAHDGRVVNIAWSRDDRHIVSLGTDGAVLFWRVDGHERHAALFASALAEKEIPNVSGHHGPYDEELVTVGGRNAIGALPNGNRVGDFVADSRVRSQHEAPWLAKLTPPTVPPAPRLDAPNSARLAWVHGVDTTASRDAVRVTPDGSVLYAAAALGVKQSIFGAPRQRFNHALERRVACLALSSSGELAATGEALCGGLRSLARRPKIALWSARTLRTRAIVDASHSSAVALLRFGIGDRVLLSVGTDERCRIVMLCTRTRRALFSADACAAHPGAVLAAAFAPPPRSAASRKVPERIEFTTVGVGGHVVFWIGKQRASGRTPRSLAIERTKAMAAAIAAASGGQGVGTLAAAAAADDDGSDDDREEDDNSGAGWVFRSRRGHVAKQSGKFQAFTSVEWATAKICAVGCEVGDIYVFENYQLVRKIQAHAKPVRLLRRGGPRDDVLLSCADDGKLIAWRATTLRPLKGEPFVFNGAVCAVRSAAFPGAFGLGSLVGGDGSTAGNLLIASEDGTIARFASWVVQFAVNPKAKGAQLVAAHPRGAVNAVAVHPASHLRCIASGGDAGAVRLWQLGAAHRLVASADLGTSCTVDALDFSVCDAGRYLAAGLHRTSSEAYVRILDGVSLVKVEKRKLGRGRVTALRFGPDGVALVAACEDGGVYIITVAGGLFTKGRLLRPAYFLPSGGPDAAAHVTRLDFSTDSAVLHINDASARRLGYLSVLGDATVEGEVGPHELPLVSTNDLLRGEEWARWSCPFAWALSCAHAMEDGRGAVTVAARAKEGRRGAPLVATGDDEGRLRLWHWPCATAAAADAGEVLVAHGCAVTDLVAAKARGSAAPEAIGWSSAFFSAGGKDGSMMAWSVAE
jgi:WD40 repeat protein